MSPLVSNPETSQWRDARNYGMKQMYRRTFESADVININRCEMFTEYKIPNLYSM